MGEEFPVTRAVKNKKGDVTGTLGVGVIDLTSLTDKLTPKIRDPFVDTVDGTATRPSTAQTTTGPHRYTIIVPNQGEDSWLNLGQADPNRINDTGLTGKSKTHIHFQTFGDPNKTMIALGGGTKHGWASYATHGATGDKLAGNTGFMMVTENIAWMDAKNQFYIVSRTGDVVVRSQASKVKIQADTGNVEIGAKTDVTIGGNNAVTVIADASATLNEAGFGAAFDANFWQLAGTKAYNAGITAADAVTAGMALFSGIRTAFTKGNSGQRGWTTTPAVDKAALLADLANFASGATQYIHQLTNPSGSATLAGSKYAGVNGGIAAGVYGNVTASVASLVSTNILGGTAGLKAMTFGGVWAGLVLSLKSLKKAELRAESDSLSLFGKTDVTLTSETAKITATAKTEVQLNATDGPAFLHGKSFYAAGGDATSYGVGGNTQGFFAGKFTSGTTFTGPGPEKKEGFWVTPSATGAVFKSAKIQLDDSKIMMKSNKLEVSAGSGNISMEGSKILIG